MQKEPLTYSLDEIDKAVELIYKHMNTCKVLTFEGPLGAGKTTLIRELLKKCVVLTGVTSPTYNYLNVYKNKQGQTFYHFDLYRIKNTQDFLSSGFDEYLYQPNSWVLIEWPEVIMQLLKKDVCSVKIDYKKVDKRLLNLALS